MGSSFGGNVALQLALRHPNKFRAVIPVEAADYAPGFYLDWWRHPHANAAQVCASGTWDLMAPQSPLIVSSLLVSSSYFLLISVAMIGAAIFFFLERGRLSHRWGTAMNLVGVIALMSSIHYFYAKDLWVLNGQAPTALRYIEWLLTFPLTIRKNI